VGPAGREGSVGLAGAAPVAGAADDDAGEGRRTSRHSDCPPEPPRAEDEEGAADADGAVGDGDAADGEAAEEDEGDEDAAESILSWDEDGVNEGRRSAGVKTEAAGLALAVLTGGAMIEP
jgi:hypothetical protein